MKAGLFLHLFRAPVLLVDDTGGVGLTPRKFHTTVGVYMLPDVHMEGAPRGAWIASVERKFSA